MAFRGLGLVEASKRYAETIMPDGGFNITDIDMTVAKVQTMIGNDGRD